MGAQLAHPFSSHPEVREGFSEVPVLEVRAPSLEVLQLPGAPQSLEDLRVVRLAQFLELLLLPRQPMCSGEGLHPVALVNQVCLDKLPPQLQVYSGPLPLLPPPLDQLQVGYLGRQQQVLRAQFSEAQALLPALHLSLASQPLQPLAPFSANPLPRLPPHQPPYLDNPQQPPRTPPLSLASQRPHQDQYLASLQLVLQVNHLVVLQEGYLVPRRFLPPVLVDFSGPLPNPQLVVSSEHLHLEAAVSLARRRNP